MLGIPDPGVWLAYLLSILCALFCLVYGVLNWNKGDETVYDEDVKWAKDEQDMEEKL